MARYLQPDRIRTVQIAGETLEIKEKIIPDGARASKYVASWCQKGDPMKPLKKLGGDGKARGVVIHNTGEIVTSPDTHPAEQYTRATWPNGNMGGAVVHFYVWRGEIWQNLSLEERGWHAGDGSTRRKDKKGTGTVGGNLDCIAIECIGGGEESIRTTALLAAWLLKQIGKSVEEGLYTHSFFKPSKGCPEYILPRWDAFEAQVKGYLTDAAGPVAPEKPEEEEECFPPCPYAGRSIVDGLKSVGAPSDFAYRGRLAEKNGIEGYKGMAYQNSAMLRLLKAGKLKKV